MIQASLVAAADEMFAVLKKTAMSPIIYEVLDVGTGITDPHGELVSSGAGIPTFVGVLDKAVKRIVDLHGLDNIGDGDCFITNDPYYGGVTHLNDVVIALPVFADGECVAWAASIAHWNDVGGKTPGSMAVDVSEIFQEGLRLPAVKLFERGKPLASVFDIISANSRLPDFVRGDLWAQVAASRKAEARIRATGRNLWHRRLSRRHRRASSWRASGAGARDLQPCRTVHSASRKSRTTARCGAPRSPFRRTASRSTSAATRGSARHPTTPAATAL